MRAMNLSIDGMGCNGCVKNVRNALDALPGVTVGNVTVGSAELVFDADRLPPEAILAALAKAGYAAREAEAAPAAHAGGTRRGGCCGSAS